MPHWLLTAAGSIIGFLITIGSKMLPHINCIRLIFLYSPSPRRGMLMLCYICLVCHITCLYWSIDIGSYFICFHLKLSSTNDKCPSSETSKVSIKISGLSVYSSIPKYFGPEVFNIDSRQQGLRQADKWLRCVDSRGTCSQGMWLK